ncbi:hypothetical protein ASC94_05840 [Massilia sp. Root418]|jgi:hypothetical protein|uniref:hypothetical protein n=1 Tax=Massilia sp. Root418 TaxID=1736532 RepID=UPI0006FEA5A7|nr:hypothetical protein [Massilia sp. Root418]KQW96374.1 hypothetical protein ASC94_05840 [Massilia sp. Root418]
MTVRISWLPSAAKLAGLAALLALGACGGGGGTPAAPGPTPPATAETLAVSAPVWQTSAGGKSIGLAASTATGTVPAWTLAAGSPGSLSAASGAAVTYVPPANVAAITQVTVHAAVGSLSKAIKLTVYPDPGQPGLALVAGRTGPTDGAPAIDGQGEAARFSRPLLMASAPDGSLYVIDQDGQPSQENRFSVRRVSAAGQVTTLSTGNDLAPGFPVSVTSIMADRDGTVYLTTGARHSLMHLNAYGGAVYKLGADGKPVLVAGVAPHDKTASDALVDGPLAAARFDAPALAGFDAENNLYLFDVPRVASGWPYRKITPAGEVSTVSAPPADVTGLPDGSTERYAAVPAEGVVQRLNADGSKTVIAGISGQGGEVLGELPGLLSGPVGLIPAGPATYALFSGQRIVKLTVPRIPYAPPTLSVTGPAVPVLAGGAPVALSAQAGHAAVATWQLLSGSPGSLSATSGPSVNYIPPASVDYATTVSILVRAGGTGKVLSFELFPSPGTPGLSLLAGSPADSGALADGQGAAARFKHPSLLTVDAVGNVYVADLTGDVSVDFPEPYGLALRKITSDGTVVTGYRNDGLLHSATGIAVDRAGNLFLSTHPARVRYQPGRGGAIYKIGAAGKLELFAGAESYTSGDPERVDGTGPVARFYSPTLAGIDGAGNLYVQEFSESTPTVPVYRKITPAAVVTTIAALPAGLQNAPDGNRYTPGNYTVLRTRPDGSQAVVAGVNGVPGTKLGALPGGLDYTPAVASAGPGVLVLISGGAVLRLVLPQ